ncbi:MAG: aldo/keto reductase [Opitutaceae bacterium]|jgi:predicted oxidoreductase
MKTYRIAKTDLTVSRIAYGCMKIGGTWDHAPVSAETEKAAQASVAAALDCGINFFDHADIYTAGKSEEVFGRILKAAPGLRDRIVLQSKVGIRFANDAYKSGEPPRYDFSHDHIIRSTEAILKRLGVAHLDILLLHRPDPLVEPSEVARAFDTLQSSGKVRHFGVSNHTPAQIELLRRHLRQPLVVNQLEFSLAQHALVSEGFSANQSGTGATSALATGIVDYCRLHDILIQPWSPVGGGKLLKADTTASSPLKETAALVASLAKAKATTAEGILLAWILHHPAGMQPIVGTTKADRVRASAMADDVTLTREEWYSLLAAARGKNVP